MYMCLDTMKLYFDQGTTPSDRQLCDYISVYTLVDLQHNIDPMNGKIYYVWEDNSVWVWSNKWVCLFSRTTYPSGYVYDGIPSETDPQVIDPVYRYDMPSVPADDNGLLHDGSVVVRDENRLIKGKLYIDEGNNNLVISSFLGGGVRLLPNGRMSTNGEFYIDNVIEGNDVNTSVAGIRARFSVLNNEMYVDYSEDIEHDTNPYPNFDHRYMVFHEGNLDTSVLRIMTPLQIYDKLMDTSTLPDPFEFNVERLNGYTSDDFALASHTHTAVQITDLPDKIEAESIAQLRRILNSMSSSSIRVSYNSATQHLSLDANTFNIDLSGDVNGTGTVDKLQNVTIETTVDPDRHIHQDLVDAIARLNSICDDLQQQIDDILDNE